jgi:hypothetical protein
MKPLGIIAPVLVLMFALACGGGSSSSSPSSPSNPTSPPTPVATRIIDVTSAKDFGAVEVGGSYELGFRILNTGTAPLTITSLRVSPGHESVFTMKFEVPPTGHSIQPGESNALFVLLRFVPSSVQSYTGVLTVLGDQTSGSNTMTYSGVGTPPTPEWSLSGNGDKAFDMPPKVRRFRFVADFTGERAEVTWYLGGKLDYSTVMGTSTGLTHVEVTGSTGSSSHFELKCPSDVRWSFTEMKQAPL